MLRMWRYRTFPQGTSYELKKIREFNQLTWEEKSKRAFETSKLTQREAPERDYTDRYERNTHEGKQVRREKGDSSLHLGVPQNAVGKPNIAVLLEHGAPSIMLEIEGKWCHLILETGSSVSIFQPGVSWRDLRDTSLRPFGVTGEPWM